VSRKRAAVLRFGVSSWYLGRKFGGDEAAFAALANLDVWIVDALRWTPHPTHAHVERTLEWVRRLEPRRTILTNMHIDLDYEHLKSKLPPGVEPAYDGLRFEHQLSSKLD